MCESWLPAGILLQIQTASVTVDVWSWLRQNNEDPLFSATIKSQCWLLRAEEISELCKFAKMPLKIVTKQAVSYKITGWLVWEAEAAEQLEERDAELQSINWCHTTKWKPITFENLFSGTKHKPARPSRIIEEEEEEALAEAMAEAAEYEAPDDGAIEIGSDEEYQ
ncbi:hypothetical protein JB92DRAFT_2831599 [Gautieria morchelliformis]|nr:hypothetical protein JB92DRAFT_2831599 [Gautieria morchelliformis]